MLGEKEQGPNKTVKYWSQRVVKPGEQKGNGIRLLGEKEPGPNKTVKGFHSLPLSSGPEFPSLFPHHPTVHSRPAVKPPPAAPLLKRVVRSIPTRCRCSSAASPASPPARCCLQPPDVISTSVSVPDKNSRYSSSSLLAGIGVGAR